MARILVVDDEPSVLSLLTIWLKAKNFEVTPAPGGEKARDLLRSEIFDAMITDIRMRPVDGMELLRLARKERPDMPVIMLTAYGSAETVGEARSLGAFDFLTKPFKMDELFTSVTRALDSCASLNQKANLSHETTAPPQERSTKAQEHQA